MKSMAANLMSGLLMILLIISAGCGQKETVKYDPENFPAPERVREDRLDESSMRTDRVEEPEPEPIVPDEPTPPEPLNLETVYFGFDRSELNPEAKATLARNARQLQERSDVYVRVEGHCDERGTVAYNLALGERRALAVRNYLVNFGIEPGRISIISYGKERPIDPGYGEQAWARNRRAEFVILNR